MRFLARIAFDQQQIAVEPLAQLSERFLVRVQTGDAPALVGVVDGQRTADAVADTSDEDRFLGHGPATRKVATKCRGIGDLVATQNRAAPGLAQPCAEMAAGDRLGIPGQVAHVAIGEAAGRGPVA